MSPKKRERRPAQAAQLSTTTTIAADSVAIATPQCRCTRCRRPLRAEKSVRRLLGPLCALAEAVAA